jgi:hypothetical protein
MLALVRTTRHRQRCLLIANGNVQVEPPGNEQLPDRPIGSQRSEAFHLHGLGTMVQEQAHQLDRALPRSRGQEPSPGIVHLGSAVEQQRRGRDSSPVHRMVQRRDAMEVLVRRLSVREPRRNVTAKHVQLIQERRSEHVHLRPVIEQILRHLSVA